MSSKQSPLPTVPVQGVTYTVREWMDRLWRIRDMVSTDSLTARAELAHLAWRMETYAERLEDKVR